MANQRASITQKFQMTFHMGSGEIGKAMADLVMNQAERFKTDPTKVLRVAIRVLAQTKANDPGLVDALNKER